MEIGGQQWRATENCSTDKGLLLLLLFFFFFFLSFLLSFSSVIPWVTMMLRRQVVMPLIACKSYAIFVSNFSLMSSSSKLQSRWHVVVRHWVTVYFQARARGQQSMERTSSRQRLVPSHRSVPRWRRTVSVPTVLLAKATAQHNVTLTL